MVYLKWQSEVIFFLAVVIMDVLVFGLQFYRLIFPLTQNVRSGLLKMSENKTLLCDEKLEHTLNLLILNNHLQIYQQLMLVFECEFSKFLNVKNV